jgi:hypothetical protein
LSGGRPTVFPSSLDAAFCCLSCRRRSLQTTPYCSRCGQRLLPPRIPGPRPESRDAARFLPAAPGIIRDRQTGLDWQQSGTLQPLSHGQAAAYIEHLNQHSWGGRDDWRLPSLPELASLLTPKKTAQGLHLPPVFDSRQGFCWSASLSPSGRGAYGVMFDPGTILAKTTDHQAFIRAVAGQAATPLPYSTPSLELARRGREILFAGKRRQLPRRQEMEDFLQVGGLFSEVILDGGPQLYFLPTEEFVRGLIRLFRHLGVRKAVEVGAGDGLLAAALTERGFPVVATDLQGGGLSDYGQPVYRADHRRAVEEFGPELAFWCWPPFGCRDPEDLIRSPHLKYYLDVGDGGRGTGMPDLAPRYRGRYLGTLSGLGYTWLDVGPFRHNRCFLFKAAGWRRAQ